jgi:hypothetical protein
LLNKKITELKHIYDQSLKLKDMIFVLKDNEEILVKYENGIIIKYKKYQDKYQIESKDLNLNTCFSWTDIKSVIHNIAIINGRIIEDTILD